MEQEWLSSSDPAVMLAHIRDKMTARKLRLFACACAIKTHGFYHATEMGAGKGGYGIWDATGEADPDDPLDRSRSPFHVAESWTRQQSNQIGVEDSITQAEKAALLREVVGNPFRPVVVMMTRAEDFARSHGHLAHEWLTPQVLSLAQAAYDERPGRKCENCDGGSDEYYNSEPNMRDAPCYVCRGTGTIDDGTLDPFRLALVADALEEEGCLVEEVIEEKYESHATCGGQGTEDIPPEIKTRKIKRPNPILAHLRGQESITYGVGKAWSYKVQQGPHVRGCWALDLILGKE